MTDRRQRTVSVIDAYARHDAHACHCERSKPWGRLWVDARSNPVLHAPI